MRRCNRVVVEAPAKINLYLDITGIAENGYHLLETVMQAVDLCDLVVIGRSAASGIRVTCSRPGIPEDSANLAYKAAVAFMEALRLPTVGLHIHIDKSIPPQAGLGGGSADAAAVLVGLDALLGTDLPLSRLREIGLALGADVPFAIQGGRALARGVGEQLTPWPVLPPCWLVIAKPAAGVGTAEAYSRYDSCERIIHGNLDEYRSAVSMFNVFEQVCGDDGTESLKSAMIRHGAVAAALSGSGSAVAGIFLHREDAQSCLSAMGSLAQETFVSAPVPYGARVLYHK